MNLSRLASVVAACAAWQLFALPKPADVPELMTTSTGHSVASVDEWERVRRPELLRAFLERVYGVRPEAAEHPKSVSFRLEREESGAYGGMAILKRVTITVRGPRGPFSFSALAALPMAARKPVPAFLLGCNRDPRVNMDPNSPVEFWDAPGIVRRGYAAVAFYFSDVTPDYSDLPHYWELDEKGCVDKRGLYRTRWNREGVFKAFEDTDAPRAGNAWGTISAWAWAMSRVMDWIETEPAIDASRVAVVGHSRGGKTALLAGVTDPRFAMVCSNDSGCSGAKLNHVDLPASEHVENITRMFPNWFCADYRKWAGRELEMPIDQHEFLALVAPRLLCVASASKDAWAGPPGEFAAARLASPAWEIYGKKGLIAPEDANHAPMVFQNGCVSYHLRPGKHNLTSWDWARYADFADRHGWNK